RSETYAHGLIVLPVYAWLVWRLRDRVGALAPQPLSWMALPAAGAGLLWLLGQLASVAAAAHAGLVLLLVIGLVAAMGWRLARVFLFPLAFLLFGVPIGDFLLPTLMSYTADFTIAALRLSGVPVYQEGLHFVIPNGRWSVVEACSGIRYLIASVMIGALYAYLSYASLRKRLLFMLVAVAVPIVANWVRAYMIVMLGYLTNNELAAGVDHLIYGWVFFGVVIMLMFMIGQRWADPDSAFVRPPVVPALDEAASRWANLIPVAIVSIVFPLALMRINMPVETYEVAYELPAPAIGWVLQSRDEVGYLPRYRGFRGQAVGVYAREADGATVQLYTAFFADQREGAEMVTWANTLKPSNDKSVNLITQSPLTTAIGALPAATVVIRDDRQAVARWYKVDGRVLTRDWEAKLRLAADRLTGRQDASMVFVVSSPLGPEREGFEHLQAFIDTHGDEMHRVAEAAERKLTR
ncbi:MAG: exosortase A, partial [Zoogloeaceae bacterium]|nr:exosortase A [Zoogloeaceae bacterium]